MKSTWITLGVFATLAVACNPLVGWEDSYSLASTVSPSEEDAGTDASETPAPTTDGGTNPKTEDAGKVG